jgi:hypothetical protein
MVISEPMPELYEPERRKPGATGHPVVLADGHEWLLAVPRYQPQADGLTTPRIDRPTDRIFECLASQSALSLTDIWEAAIPLLRANYELSNEEVSLLLSVAPGGEADRLTQAVLDIIFGHSSRRRGYSDWIRASLLANGIGDSMISADDLPDVMSILVATHRTVPLTRFADVCQEAQLRDTLDTLL